MELTLSVKNFHTHKKNSVLSICLMNNVFWDPLTIYEVRLKPKPDIIHEVTIECEDKNTQEWVYKYESRMASEYRVSFESGKQFKFLTSLSLGYLKKGEYSILRISFSPDSMNKQEATMSITNGLFKEIYKITGKPLHSRKI